MPEAVNANVQPAPEILHILRDEGRIPTPVRAGAEQRRCEPRSPAKRGRRTKLSLGLIEAFSDAIKKVNNIRAACAACRISERSFYEWTRCAREGRGTDLQVEFADAVETARARLEADLVACIVEHAKKNWRAARFLLERRFPSEWAPLSRRARSGAGNTTATPKNLRFRAG